MTGSLPSVACVWVWNETLLISLASLCRVLRLIGSGDGYLMNLEEFEEGALEYGFERFLCHESDSE